nr:uncharacterized protein LOC105846914 [Hydra vulgaris]
MIEVSFLPASDRRSIPTGCPSNLTVTTISSTALLLSWDKVEYSLRKGVIITYLYTCYSTENSISSNVGYNTFNVAVNDLVPDTYYNCSVVACTIMGCGPPAIRIIKTLVGNIHMDSSIDGFVEKDIVNISLQLSGNGFNVTIEYFFPLFVTLTSERVQNGFIKLNSAQFKYIFSGYFNTNGANIHSITLKVNKRNCFRDFLIEIPVRLSYQNKLGILRVVTMAYQKSFTCLYKVLPKIPRDKNALSEYYGRGIYIDNERFDLYFCVNQHVESIVPACYYSKIHGGNSLWTDLDVRVGCVLGHHLVTKELWAIHRNQKSYLYFHGFYGKWLAVSKGDNIAASNFNKSMRMSLEDDEDQVYTFGLNQWMGNAEGLFYRNDSLSSWLQKVRWTIYTIFTKREDYGFLITIKYDPTITDNELPEKLTPYIENIISGKHTIYDFDKSIEDGRRLFRVIFKVVVRDIPHHIEINWCEDCIKLCWKGVFMKKL